MKREIEAVLRPLITKPLWGRLRAADMETFAFGDRIPATEHHREYGEFALHVQCPWRIRARDRVLVGSDDLFSPADDRDVEASDRFDWDVHESRRDRRMAELFEVFDVEPPQVSGVTADELGGVQIDLSNGMTLELFPADSDRGEYGEFWRFFADDGDHFVVGAAGVDIVGTDGVDS